MVNSVHEMPQINLVQKKGAVIDSFLHWALNTGRLIIIITETVALSAFALRFSLDRQIIDLHDTIKREQAIVSLLKHNENTFRNLQDRLSLITTLDTQSQKQSNDFFSLLKLIPSDIQLSRFEFTQDTIQMSIEVHSTEVLAQFINKLKSQSIISGVSIEKIDNRISSGTIEVTLTAALKKNA